MPDVEVRAVDAGHESRSDVDGLWFRLGLGLLESDEFSLELSLLLGEGGGLGLLSCLGLQELLHCLGLGQERSLIRCKFRRILGREAGDIQGLKIRRHVGRRLVAVVDDAVGISPLIHLRCIGEDCRREDQETK